MVMTWSFARFAANHRVSLVLFVVLPTMLVASCASIVSNSERYYQNQPRRPINWREHLTV
jgi:hypothetical protein